jgi:hypothetical protein
MMKIKFHGLNLYGEIQYNYFNIYIVVVVFTLWKLVGFSQKSKEGGWYGKCLGRYIPRKAILGRVE